MNHHHHHPGMTLGPLPIGMLANGNGTPVGIGIRLPIMTASLPPQMAHQHHHQHQPPHPHQHVPVQHASSSPSNSQLVMSMSPDSSEDIEKCIRNRMNSSTTISPAPHQPMPTCSVSQANCTGTNNSNNIQHWNTIMQQPMAGMLMNHTMMGMAGVPGVLAPASCNVMTEPNMLYGVNLLSNTPPNGQPAHPHQHPTSLNTSSQQSNVSLQMPKTIPITTNSSPTTIINGCQANQSFQPQLTSTGIVNGSIPGPICSPSTNVQQPATMLPKDIIHCKSCTLFPPNPSAPQPTTRERPPGCRTVFVGGLPENGNEDLVRELFERCGEITTIRMSKKNFCHIRFELESNIENAIYLSGYRVRIGSNSDPPNIGRLHVDYAQARDDLYEWECRQRQSLREQRHRERLEQERLLPPSPPPVVHYSDMEAVNLAEKLKGDETFIKAVQVLMTWLERGDCSKKNANTFYSMIQSTNSHVRRLLNEKSQYEDELQKAKELARHRMQGLIIQFCQIEKVFITACHKKAWDHFSKAQRKNIDIWKKQASEIKNMQLEEALSERNEEEMELSESDSEENSHGKRMRLDEVLNEQTKMNQLKEENDSLRCQVIAFKNEVDQLKVDLRTELEAKEQHIRTLQEQLLNHRRSPTTISSPTQSDIELQPKSLSTSNMSNYSGGSSPITSMSSYATTATSATTTTTNNNRISISNNANEKRLEKCDSTQQILLPLNFSSETRSNENSPKDKEQLTLTLSPPASNAKSSSSSSSSSSNSPTSSRETSSTITGIVSATAADFSDLPKSIQITEKEARLVGIISTFLHVHPFGASLDYIWSYTQKIIPGVYPIQIEALLFKFNNSLFRQELTGIGATLERKWVFTGFNSNNSNSNSNTTSPSNSNNNSSLVLNSQKE